MNNFTLDLNRFSTKAMSNLDGVVSDVVTQLATKIVYTSPVGDPSYWKMAPPPDYIGGQFRGDWQLGVDEVPENETGIIDPAGFVTMSYIKAAIPAQAGGHIFYLVNNVPYAQEIEDGTGSRRQAPNGVVGLAVANFQGVVREATAARAA